VLPAGEGGEEPDADVHGPVAHREDPPVSREMVAGAVAEVEVRLDPRIVVERTLEVAPDGHPQRVAAVTGGAEGAAEARVRAVGNHYIARADVLRPVRTVSANLYTLDEPAVDDRRDGLRARPQGRPALHGPLGDHLVEVAAAHDVAVGRELGVMGPLELEGDAVADRAEPVEALEALQRAGETHVVQLAHGPGRETVAAGLLARETLALDHQHPVAALGEPERGRRPGRPRAHHEGVPAGGGAHARMLPQRSRPQRSEAGSEAMVPAGAAQRSPHAERTAAGRVSRPAGSEAMVPAGAAQRSPHAERTAAGRVSRPAGSEAMVPAGAAQRSPHAERTAAGRVSRPA